MNGTVRVDICAPSRIGALAPKSMDAPGPRPTLRALGHNIKAVHASGALFVVDFQFAAVPGHTSGRAQLDDFLLNVKFAPVSTGVGPGIGFDFSATYASTPSGRCGCRLSMSR